MKNKDQLSVESADYAHPGNDVIEKTVVERLVSLGLNPRRLREVGEAVPLLAFIVQRCGDQDVCMVNLHEVAEQIGAGHSTIKNWLKRLIAMGWVTRTLRGRQGVEVGLTWELVSPRPVSDRSAEMVQETRQSLQALKLTFNHAIDSLLSRHQAQEVA